MPCKKGKKHRKHTPITLFYGGYLGIPLCAWPKDIEDGEIKNGIRHVKTKSLQEY